MQDAAGVVAHQVRDFVIRELSGLWREHKEDWARRIREGDIASRPPEDGAARMERLAPVVKKQYLTALRTRKPTGVKKAKAPKFDRFFEELWRAVVTKPQVEVGDFFDTSIYSAMDQSVLMGEACDTAFEACAAQIAIFDDQEGRWINADERGDGVSLATLQTTRTYAAQRRARYKPDRYPERHAEREYRSERRSERRSQHSSRRPRRSADSSSAAGVTTATDVTTATARSRRSEKTAKRRGEDASRGLGGGGREDKKQSSTTSSSSGASHSSRQASRRAHRRERENASRGSRGSRSSRSSRSQKWIPPGDSVSGIDAATQFKEEFDDSATLGAAVDVADGWGQPARQAGGDEVKCDLVLDL